MWIGWGVICIIYNYEVDFIMLASIEHWLTMDIQPARPSSAFGLIPCFIYRPWLTFFFCSTHNVASVWATSFANPRLCPIGRPTSLRTAVCDTCIHTAARSHRGPASGACVFLRLSDPNKATNHIVTLMQPCQQFPFTYHGDELIFQRAHSSWIVFQQGLPRVGRRQLCLRVPLPISFKCMFPSIWFLAAFFNSL